MTAQELLHIAPYILPTMAVVAAVFLSHRFYGIYRLNQDAELPVVMFFCLFFVPPITALLMVAYVGFTTGGWR